MKRVNEEDAWGDLECLYEVCQTAIELLEAYSYTLHKLKHRTILAILCNTPIITKCLQHIGQPWSGLHWSVVIR